MSDNKLLLDILHERDSELHQTVEKFMPLALEFMEKGPIPKTVGVFLSFIASTEFIKNGILDLVETENAYAKNILFRSLIEHFLRFQYIWLRFAEEKSDAPVEAYLKHSLFKEALQIGRSWKRVARILGHDSGLTPHEALKLVIKESTGHTAKEIDEQASQFEYGKIIEYIFEKMNSHKEQERPFLLNIIPKYSDLSCFVHGAPGAMAFMKNLHSNGKLTADLLDDATVAFQMAGSVKMFSLLTFSQYDRSFASPYLRVVELLRTTDSPVQAPPEDV
jgi:hypothetical protein